MIDCRVLGPVEVTVGGGAAPPELLWRKHLALLIYLARSPKRARTREHLTGLLWPEKSERAAKHSLNEALRVLRRTVGEAGIDTSAGQVRLAPGAVRLDVDQLAGWIVAGSWSEASAVVAGEFLEGFSVPGCEGFEGWLGAERRHWCEHGVTALLGSCALLLREGRAHEALLAARRAESLDPHSDAAARGIMTALAVQGDSVAALAHAERFGQLIVREVGGAPSAETRALSDRIRGGRGPRAYAGVPRNAEAGLRRAPLAGRESELSDLLGLWERCRAGDGATAIVLEGEAGTGKTRMLQEFTARAALSGATVSLVRAVPGDADVPRSGILGLARGGLLEAPGLAAAPPPSLAAFATILPEWAERFRPPAGIAVPPASEALVPVLAAVLGEGPLLLVVDDAQWSDSASLTSLVAALRDLSAAPLCLVLATLSEPHREEIDQLRRRLGSDLPGRAIRLGPLGNAALRQLAAWALPAYDAVALDRVCRRVASDSAGLPLLAVELLSAVAQGLDLRQGAAAWPEPMHTLTQSLPGDLPDSVVAALRIGFRRLSQEAQQVLAAAAVLELPVNEARLLLVTALPAGAVSSALAELEWQGWLEADGRGYGFVANLARRVIARDMITPGQRARLLARAGP